MEKPKVCMNDLCGASLAEDSSSRKGWPLRSGHFASLCDKCSTAYAQLTFCDSFHSEDTGWRECTSCGKRLHCGCVASSSLLELLDSGGVSCISCINASGSHLNTSDEKPKEVGLSAENSVGELRSSSADTQVNAGNLDKIRFKQLDVGADDISHRPLNPSVNDNRNMYRSQMKDQETMPPLSGEDGTTPISSFNQVMAESSQPAKYDIYRQNKGVKDECRTLVQTNLTIALATPSGKPNIFPSTVGEERELSKPVSSFQQGSWSRHILPKTPKSVFAQGMDTSASMNSQIRVARPPVEGRVKNQLLPRYWPRITEQELQQISGDSNSTIVPLFEKVLSASDAGRIGRLVLPKACAEAYFPPISQPEGLPLGIQDMKGKEWMFQFRFWPNNNSRMYVLEGVTPCIQSMQLQAGDTVTFSRMDPEGKLLMGFRKASTAISLQTLKGSTDSHLNALSRLGSHGDINWHMNEKHGGRARDGSFQPSLLVPEKKRSRNIGSKNKRTLIDGHDALELKHTWEELQDILRPPASVIPNTVAVEDHEFEEYEEPPVLGKGSIFTVRFSGEPEQWAQCDNCSKWRRLPADFLLPPRWTCQENVWDLGRCSCAAPDELNPTELENLLKQAKDFQKRRASAYHRPERDQELAIDTQNGMTSVADNMSEPGPTSVATTTKHPRHRPGCSCIVCIQPPSGKGKHNPTCTCNVCMTVKRRFKTLMLRKKKRQSDREAEIAQKNQLVWGPNEEAEVDSTSRQEHESLPCKNETGQGNLDLNIHPHRVGGGQQIGGSGSGSTHVSMMGLLQVANLPLETYLKQNGLTSLAAEQQTSSGSHALPQATGGSEGVNEDGLIPAVQEQQDDDNIELGGLNHSRTDPS